MNNQPTNRRTTQPADEQSRQQGARRLLSSRRGWIVAAAATVAVIGLSGCAATSTAATSATPSATSTAPAAGHGMPAAGGGGSNARSGAAEGGTVGTVSAVTSSGFTLTTSAGQKVTVKEASSTTYKKGSSSSSVSAVTANSTALVLGIVNGTTITAAQITVQPASSAATASYTPSPAVPFKQGSPSAAKNEGQIPTNYTEGDGTIVTGTTADKAAEAALGSYSGGVVDRVVKLSNGEYEVHFIGVNWPHHIFVSTAFEVVGAF
ncbi:MAG: hypothetical protein JWQ12_2127 [Glaciihabitans sp.]|nr:hypothetical protein [Glaciihabitans sp.]